MSYGPPVLGRLTLWSAELLQNGGCQRHCHRRSRKVKISTAAQPASKNLENGKPKAKGKQWTFYCALESGELSIAKHWHVPLGLWIQALLESLGLRIPKESRAALAE